MKAPRHNSNTFDNYRVMSASGFSLVELIMSLLLSLFILGVAVATFSGALGSRDRESSRTDALTSAQAALNIMSREIGNSGYGLNYNGIVAADSSRDRLHFRANIDNVGTDPLTGNDDGLNTAQAGEDLTFYYDSATQSVVRYDRSTNTTSGIINRVSDVDFKYWNYVYNYDTSTDPPTVTTTISAGAAGPNTARVEILLTVTLANARMQAVNRQETVTSDVILRNSIYMREQY